MATEIRVPTLGESVTEATIGKWFKKAGEAVKADEPLVELETDKVTLEVNAPAGGTLEEIVAKEGETVGVNALLGSIGAAGTAAKPAAKPAAQSSEPKSAETKSAEDPEDITVAQAAGPHAIEGKPGEAGASTLGASDASGASPQGGAATPPAPTVAASNGAASSPDGGARQGSASGASYGSHQAGGATSDPVVAARTAAHENGPAVGRMARESGLDPAGVAGSGRDGRVTKGDMLAAIAAAPPPSAAAPAQASTPVQARAPSPEADAPREERVRMTKLRQTIARRLKEAQNSAAMLTTFNDVDMTGVMEMRARYKDAFEKKHGAKLGFMGFFVKACVQALKELPAVNAEIDGADLVYKNYYHVGIAVGTEKGLVVPVVRDADDLTVAGIEKRIADFGRRARDGQLRIDEMQGGTFTITNGGIYGSLMSTPILNAPQSGILGMHRIEERPVVRAGQVVVRPMMYLALSYDHRIVDGREAVTFLVRVKEGLEDPARLVLDL